MGQFYLTINSWLNIRTVAAFAIAYLVFIAFKVGKLNRVLSVETTKPKGIKFISAIVIVSVFLLIFTSLYMQWTPVYNDIIDGIQGRYFISLLMPLFLLLYNYHGTKDRVETLSFSSQWMIMLINICACGSCLFYFL